MRYRQTGKTEYDSKGKIIRSGVSKLSDGSTDRHHFVGGVFESIVSPIDGRVISNREQLANHNRQHGVTNDLDSLKEQSARSRQTKEYSRQDRIAVIRDAVERVQSSGYNRRDRL